MNQVTPINRDTILATYKGNRSYTTVAVLQRDGRLTISSYEIGATHTTLTDTIIPRLDNAVMHIINDMAQVGAPIDDPQVFIDWLNS